MSEPINYENPSIKFPEAREVSKGWGKEVIFTPQFASYCGKLLVYKKNGAISSMHYHAEKHETFYVLSGIFKLKYYDLNTADLKSRDLKAGDSIVIPPHNPHQLFCIEAGTILEASTKDDPFDNYRIAKGDSQKSLDT